MSVLRLFAGACLLGLAQVVIVLHLLLWSAAQ